MKQYLGGNCLAVLTTHNRTRKDKFCFGIFSLLAVLSD